MVEGLKTERLPAEGFLPVKGLPAEGFLLVEGLLAKALLALDPVAGGATAGTGTRGSRTEVLTRDGAMRD